MIRALDAFTAGPLTARRVTHSDLAFAQTLFAMPALNAHKPLPPSQDQITTTHRRDLSHWDTHGIGRYLVEKDSEKVGFCGLTHRNSMAGLNLSYHLLPSHWGQGHATDLIAALVHVARGYPMANGVVYGLVRPANPASVRVLLKAGFRRAEDMILGGAPTTRFVLSLRPD